jgi:hypothetical protein
MEICRKVQKPIEGHGTEEHSRVFLGRKVYKELIPRYKGREAPLPPFQTIPLEKPYPSITPTYHPPIPLSIHFPHTLIVLLYTSTSPFSSP